ncbi:MAG TPA: hypothetical protein VFB79_22385 [Candidatus Angelobacter sp.]|nr:hypothetical protein [Candidatus Angelobacter sp.]
MQCSLCPFGRICLRWGRAISLHLDRAEIACALECLTEVLDCSGCAFALGQGPFCASHTADGYYYLVCRERVTLRLSEDEARSLQNILSSAQNVLAQSSAMAAQIM